MISPTYGNLKNWFTRMIPPLFFELAFLIFVRVIILVAIF